MSDEERSEDLEQNDSPVEEAPAADDAAEENEDPKPDSSDDGDDDTEGQRFSSSDRRLKKDIVQADGALESLRSL
jgi:hypothetical protein